MREKACGHAWLRRIKGRAGPSCQGGCWQQWPRLAVVNRNCGHQLEAGLGSWHSEEHGGGSSGTVTGPLVARKETLEQSRGGGQLGQGCAHIIYLPGPPG